MYEQPHPRIGDLIRVTWMEGQPVAEVIGKDDEGNPVVEHPLLPGLGPMIVDVFDFVCRSDDPALCVGNDI